MQSKSLASPSSQETMRRLNSIPIQAAKLLATPFAFKSTGEKNHLRGRTPIPNVLYNAADQCGYVPQRTVNAVARFLRATPKKAADGIRANYDFLTLQQTTSQSTVYFCDCMNCRMHGSEEIMSSLQRKLIMKNVRFAKTNWLGWCVNGAPAALVKNVGDESVHAMLNLRHNDDRFDCMPAYVNPYPGMDLHVIDSDETKQQPSIIRNIPILEKDKHYFSKGKGPVSSVLWKRSRKQLLDAVWGSSLTGCSGSSNLVGQKWDDFLKQKTKSPRSLVINASEGLPSNFKDYYLLQHPQCRLRFVVGMCLAAHILGIQDIWIYLRYPYRNLAPLIADTVARYKMLNPEVRRLSIQVVYGAGPYITGEQDALLANIQGKDIAPSTRISPKDILARKSLFGNPTLVHNVETVAWLPYVCYHGAQEFAKDNCGMKLVSISGHVSKPTLAEVCVGKGMTVKDLLLRYSGVPLEDIEAVEIGGILQPILYPKSFDEPLSLLKGNPNSSSVNLLSGSVVVCKKGTSFTQKDMQQAKADFATSEHVELS